jgi:hypothetical protein
MQKKFNSYSDPAHGWAKVPRSVIEELEIADKVSHFSYQRGDDVFLEEDADLTLFIRTFVGRFGFEPTFDHNSSNKMSKIRGYESYEYLTPEKKEKVIDLMLRMMRCRNWNKQGRNRIVNAGLQTLEYWQGQYGF